MHITCIYEFEDNKMMPAEKCTGGKIYPVKDYKAAFVKHSNCVSPMISPSELRKLLKTSLASSKVDLRTDDLRPAASINESENFCSAFYLTVFACNRIQ